MKPVAGAAIGVSLFVSACFGPRYAEDPVTALEISTTTVPADTVVAEVKSYAAGAGFSVAEGDFQLSQYRKHVLAGDGESFSFHFESQSPSTFVFFTHPVEHSSVQDRAAESRFTTGLVNHLTARVNTRIEPTPRYDEAYFQAQAGS